MIFSEKELIEIYEGLTPDARGLNTTGGIMTREGGFVEYQECAAWLGENVSTEDGFIEIGSAWGGSFHMWSSLIPNGPKISIDFLDTENYPFFTEERFNHRETLWKQRFTDVYSVYGDSQAISTFQKVKSLLGNKQVGWLYIDGNHFYPGYILDYVLYKRFVKPGGFIGFHDVGDSILSDDIWTVGGFFSTLSNKVFEVTKYDGIGIIQV